MNTVLTVMYLFRLAYIAKSYSSPAAGKFEVAAGEGVFVEMDDYPGKGYQVGAGAGTGSHHLNIGPDKQETVWTAK